MKILKCKGASDLMPQDVLRFRRIEEAFRACCSSWGYQEIRTPTLEYLHLFTSAGTLSPSMLSRVYSFLDWDGWSGERVVLRPDGTIPAARFYVENLSNTPVAKLCYVENMFSFEGTGQESRERWQCGAELIGSTEPEGDAELIMLAMEILRELHINPINVKLSHVGLFKALLQDLGITEEERGEMLAEILSGNVKATDQLKSQFPEIKGFLKLLLDLQGKSRGFVENLRGILPPTVSTIGPYIDDLAQIAALLDSMGQDYQIDFASGEGFEYYTGMVFQFYSSGELLGKGGRYDELIPLVGGENVPASGFALFTDKISPIKSEKSPSSSDRILLNSRTGQTGEMKYSFEIANLLRKQGYVVEMDFGTGDGADCRWVVSAEKKGENLLLSLTDKTSGKKQKGLSAGQLLQKLEEAK